MQIMPLLAEWQKIEQIKLFLRYQNGKKVWVHCDASHLFHKSHRKHSLLS